MESLVVTPISQVQVNQWAGCAGRTAPGKCFRLYTEAAYQSEMTPATVPKIQRTNMANKALLLKAMGINNILTFPFMEPPSAGAVYSALHLLFDLGALDGEGLLTRLGRRMVDIPMDPRLARALIAAAEKGCSAEMLSIATMLVDHRFYRPQDEKQCYRADAKKARFHGPTSDHLTLFNVRLAWSRTLTRHGYPVISCSGAVHRAYPPHALRRLLLQRRPAFIRPGPRVVQDPNQRLGRLLAPFLGTSIAGWIGIVERRPGGVSLGCGDQQGVHTLRDDHRSGMVFGRDWMFVQVQEGRSSV
ncbi:ATP-dependent RNA helicase dhx8 [Madurella mycetomatis]|uniref:ATP-dependent RNA helicase dhx8 n=1 Tax=Madurella mycetomatis TaxID=100816 RepID=A0A175WD40_9PEZI|nr:ATP-dependent RNA helicase dhx8 [Madurella mycetomatis]